MRLEEVLPLLRKGGIVFHGAFMHKLDAEENKLYVNNPMSGNDKWMEIEPNAEMLVCDEWNLIGGPNWRNGR